jgi:tRNA A37 threonylcarbamoyladenosine dehydratase
MVKRLYEKNQESSENSGDDDVTIENHLAIVDKLTKATVAVIGLGGVGSWAAEALCRSGIGNLILIDLDDICISNTNRQLHAMSSTVGQLKIEEMKRRLLDINPQCNITNILDFVSEDNVKDVLESLRPELTVCLDAIDGQYEKTALIAACAEGGIPIVTCGGAAGRSDPTKIVCDDITRSVEDRLLFWCRKNLRQKFGFTKGVANIKIKPKRWGISTVFSTEVLRPISQTSNGSPSSSLRTCDGPMGTACFVTGTYGFVAASRVVEMIANDDITVPNLKRMKHN